MPFDDFLTKGMHSHLPLNGRTTLEKLIKLAQVLANSKKHCTLALSVGGGIPAIAT